MDSAGTMVPVASGNDSQVPEELKPLHNYYEKWKKQMSGMWSKLVSEKVREIWELNPKLKISQCIVFGLGSLDKALQDQNLWTGRQSKTDKDFWDIGIRTVSNDLVAANELRQFIVVRMTIDFIKEIAHPIKTYFQDPKFTDLDKAYLKYHGYGVLEGDSGFGMADSTTLVFAFRCNGWLGNALRPSPAVYAGTDLNLYLETWYTNPKMKDKDRRDGLSLAEQVELKAFEDYTDNTNAYSFPMPETLDEWIDSWKDGREDLGPAARVELKALEDYTNDNSVYSSPMLEVEDSIPYPQSVEGTYFELDRGAFIACAIRVVKTLHKDHRAT